MPASQDLQLILKGKDEKYAGYDELIQVPKILNIEELMEIWYFVNKLPYHSNVNNFIHAIVREFTLCDRIDKGNTEDLKPSTGLCSGCHFNTDQNVCNKVDSILSVRVAKDLLRYSKALAWLLGLNIIDINIVTTISPFVIAHRVAFVKRELEKPPYWGNKYEFSKNIINLVQKRFINRETCYQIAERFRNGEPKQNDLLELKKFEKNDLIVKFDLLPYVEALKDNEYRDLAQQIKDASKKGNIEKLSKIRSILMENLEFPNRADLINWCNLELYKQTVTDFTFDYKDHKEAWADISSEFPNLDTPLKEALSKRQTKQIRTEDILIELNVTGIGDDNKVNIQISGGSEAIRLIKILENKDYIQKE
jgi:hypothetical protein